MKSLLKVFLRSIVGLSLLVVYVGSSYAQREPTKPLYQKVFPGDASVDANRLTPHKVKSNWSMLYELTKVEKDGRPAFAILIYFGDENAIPDKIYFDCNSLAYIGRILEHKDYKIEVAYSKGRFTGGLVPLNGSDYRPREYDKAYSHNFFEPAIVNYFIAALPLKVGYRASVPTIDLNNGSNIWWANIEVLAREKIESNGKTYDTWKVSSKGIKDKTIWISTSESFAVKMQTAGNPGSWMVNESLDKPSTRSVKSSSAGSAPSSNPDPLAFFAGTWKRDGLEGFEKWERAGATSFSGKGYRVVDGKEEITETMEIKSVDGNVFFIATLVKQGIKTPVTLALSGVSEVEFKAEDSKEIIKGFEYSFENEESEVIKKLIFRKVSANELIVQLTNGEGEFSYKLTKQ